MAKSQTITFNIIGNDQLSGVLKSVQNTLNSFPRKILSQQKALGNAQGLLRNIEAYKQLQNSIRAMQATQSQLAQDKNNLFNSWKDARKQLDSMRAAYQRLKDVYKNNKSDLLRDQLKAARGELKAQEKLLSNLGKNYDALPSQALKLQQQLAAQQQKLAQLRIQIPTGNIAAAESALRAQIDQTTNSLNREIAAFERRNQAAQQFSQAQQNMANAWSNFQSAMQTADTLMTPFKDSAQNAITFEAAMKRVEGLTSMDAIRSGNLDKVRADMARLTEQAEQLGAATEFTSTEIARAMQYYGYAGWDAAQIERVMPSTVDMASVTGVQLDRLADMFSDDLTVLGIRAGDQIKLTNGQMVDAVQHISDAWTFAVTKANMNAEDLHTALTYNAGGLRLAGLSAGDIFGFNMILANAGIKGSKAGTALNTGVIRMMAPPKKAAKALEELGENASDAEKEIARTQEAMAALGLTMDASVTDKIKAMKRAWDANKLLGEAGDTKNAAMLDAIVGKHAFKGWAELMDSNKLEQALEIARRIDTGEIEGWTKDSAAVMRDTTETSIKYLESALDALQRTAGQALAPTIRAAAEALTPMVQSLTEFVKAHPEVVQAAAAIAAALAAATVAVAGFSLAMAGVRFFSAGLQTAGILFGGLGGKISTVATALAAFPLKHPALLALAAVALVIAANWDKVCSVMKRVADAFNAAIPEWKAGHFSAAADAFKAAWFGAIDTVEGRLKTLGEVNLAPMADLIKQVNPAAPQPSTIGEKTSEPIDHSTIETAIAQTAGLITEGGQQAADAIKLAGETQAQTLATSTDTTAFMFDAVTAATQSATDALYMASPATQALADSSINATGNVDALSASSGGATGNINSLSGSSSQAAGAVSGLGAAAQSAIGALLSAGAQAAGAIGGAVGAIWSAIGAAGSAGGSLGAAVASNAEGGIYSKGQFLTTFAEKSPEAAIPLDGSKRAFNLWQQTGNLLGVDSSPINLSINVNVAGNAEKQDVYDGVQAALPDLRGLLEDFYHEKMRRSFA